MSLGTWHFSEKGNILKKLNKPILVKCNHYAVKRCHFIYLFKIDYYYYYFGKLGFSLLYIIYAFKREVGLRGPFVLHTNKLCRPQCSPLPYFFFFLFYSHYNYYYLYLFLFCIPPFSILVLL